MHMTGWTLEVGALHLGCVEATAPLRKARSPFMPRYRESPGAQTWSTNGEMRQRARYYRKESSLKSSFVLQISGGGCMSAMRDGGSRGAQPSE